MAFEPQRRHDKFQNVYLKASVQITDVRRLIKKILHNIDAVTLEKLALYWP